MENVFTHCAANWDHGKSHVTGKAGSFCTAVRDFGGDQFDVASSDV